MFAKNLWERCYGPKTLRLALVKDFLRVTLIESGKLRTRVWVSLSQGTFPGSHCPQAPRINTKMEYAWTFRKEGH